MPPAADIPVLADSKAPNHLLNSRTDIDPRHDDKAYVGYADGHVKWGKEEQMDNPIYWDDVKAMAKQVYCPGEEPVASSLQGAR